MFDSGSMLCVRSLSYRKISGSVIYPVVGDGVWLWLVRWFQIQIFSF